MIILYVILGVVLELVSIGLSIFVTCKSVLDEIIKICDNGYIFDAEKMEEVAKTVKKDENNILKVIKKVAVFIPGVNIIYSLIEGLIFKKNIMKDEHIKASLVPMTEKEKSDYSRLNGKFQKVSYILSKVRNNNDKLEDGTRDNVTCINNSSLSNLDFTYDETVKLNELSGNNLVMGMFDGVPVAFIGVPENETDISKVNFASEFFTNIHEFKKISEEEAKDLEFIVYPYYSSNDQVIKLVQEIRSKRIEEMKDTRDRVLEQFKETSIRLIQEYGKEEIQEDDEIKLTKK